MYRRAQTKVNDPAVSHFLMQKRVDGLRNQLNPQHFQEGYRNLFEIEIPEYNPEVDSYYISKILVPYLSSVYSGIRARSNKDYISIHKLKLYMNLPDLLSERLCRQINANGDERIDHDEFVKFFITILMGKFQQKQLVAFKCYDSSGEQCVTRDQVKVMLKNIPLLSLKHRQRMTASIEESMEADSSDQASETKTPNDGEALQQHKQSLLSKMKMEDEKHVDQFVEAIFSSTPRDSGFYFDEFCQLMKMTCCDLYFAVFDCLYHFVPCIKNHFIMRANFMSIVQNVLTSPTGEMTVVRDKILDQIVIVQTQSLFSGDTLKLAKPVLPKFVQRVMRKHLSPEPPKPQTKQVSSPMTIKESSTNKRRLLRKPSKSNARRLLSQNAESPKSSSSIGKSDGSKQASPFVRDKIPESFFKTIGAPEEARPETNTLIPAFNHPLKNIAEESEIDGSDSGTLRSEHSNRPIFRRKRISGRRGMIQSGDRSHHQASTIELSKNKEQSLIFHRFAQDNIGDSSTKNTSFQARNQLSMNASARLDVTITPLNNSRSLLSSPIEGDANANSIEAKEMQIPTPEGNSLFSRSGPGYRMMNLPTPTLNQVKSAPSSPILQRKESLQQKQEFKAVRQEYLNLKQQMGGNMPRLDIYRRKRMINLNKEEESSSPSEASLVSDLGESEEIERSPEYSQKMTLSEKLLKRKKIQVAQGRKQIELIQTINSKESQMLRKLGLRNKRRSAIRSTDSYKFGEVMSQTLHTLNNGFGIPITSTELSPCKFRGDILLQTKIGNFRQFFMVLHNNEMFLYTSGTNPRHEHHYILNGAYIKQHRVHMLNNACLGDPKHSAPLVEKDLIKSRSRKDERIDRFRDIKRLYPIDISLGGREGTIHLFFESVERQSVCLQQLQIATDHHDINDYYTFEEISQKDVTELKNKIKLQKNNTIMIADALGDSNGAPSKSSIIQASQSQTRPRNSILRMNPLGGPEGEGMSKKEVEKQARSLDRRLSTLVQINDFRRAIVEQAKSPNGLQSQQTMGKANQFYTVTGIHKITKHQVTIRIFKKKEYTQPGALRDLMNQVSIHQLTAHLVGVRRLLDHFQSKQNLYLCFEKISESVTLQQYVHIVALKNINHVLTEQKVRDIFMFLAINLEKMHSNGILVKNLDTQTIQMTSNNEEASPKITNLEKAEVIGLDEMVRDLHGDFRFRAPEVIQNKPYGFKADCWSMGVILFYLLTSKLPFESHYLEVIQEDQQRKANYKAELLGLARRSKNWTANRKPASMAWNQKINNARSLSMMPNKETGVKQVDTREKIEELIKKEEPPLFLITGNGRSGQSIDLVKKLLHKNPEQRWSLAQALKHPWINLNLFKKKSMKQDQVPSPSKLDHQSSRADQVQGMGQVSGQRRQSRLQHRLTMKA